MRIRSIVAVIMAVTLLAAGCSSEGEDPADTLNDYVAAYNSGDIDAVMAVFTEESVVYGHPFETESSGLTAIRSVQVDDINAAATENAYTISNVEVSDNTVTWDHVWVNDEGDQFCKQGQTAVVEDGKIVSWTWAGGGSDCP